MYHYEHDYLIKHFATDFKKKYGVDCYAALHHNKRKTNFHIHLIFAERTKLEKPVVKVASRNMFYDERGKHVRTKKEILDASGDIRNGCKIIRKGEVYEKKEFSIKVDRFKKDSFLDEAKVFFTNEINQLVLHEEDKLKVFDKNSPYLATKKIGKNNPMEEQIKADNEVRQEWNRTVDRAIVSGVSEEDISRIKKNEITEKVRYSIDLYGDRPDLLASIIKLAIAVLELLINRIMLAAVGVAEKMLDIVSEESRNIEAKTYPTMPTMSPLAKKYLIQKNLCYNLIFTTSITKSKIGTCLPKQQGDKYYVSDDSIIIARSGIPGATRILCNPSSNIIFCGFIICCTPSDNTLQNYLTLYLRQFEGSSATQTGGSILKNVSQETLKNLIVPIPPQSLLNQFNDSILPIYNLINSNTKENVQLITLRDWLLPMLMNGQTTIED